MVDPSFLVSEDGVEWLQEDPAALGGLVVPATFMYWLTSARPHGREELLSLIATPDQEMFEYRWDQLRELLADVEPFRYDSVELAEPATVVLTEILEGGGMVAAVRAEEWAFLWSNSWMLSKLHLPVDVFREAGAIVVEYGRRLRDQMLDVVIPHEQLPPAVTPALLARAGAKWLVLGGAGAAGTSLGPVGGALGVATVPILRAFDP